jgi:hypothetical protein
MVSLLNLGAAPRAATPIADGYGSLLIVLSGSLAIVRPPTRMEVVHRNETWHLTYPNSVVQDRGTIYIGMRSAIARLTPVPGGFSEDWLVPSACVRRSFVSDVTPCRCIR